MQQWLLEKSPEWRQRVLLALVFGVPIFFLRHVSDPINIPKLALLSLGVAMAGCLRISEILAGADWKGLRRLEIPAAALLGPLLLAWLLSPHREWALLGQYPRYLGLLPYILTIVFGVLLADAFARDALPVAWALLAAGALAGAYSVVQVLDLDPLGWSAQGGEVDAATSTLGNPNFTGGFLAMILPVGVALWVQVRERRPIVGALTAFVLIGLILARSEGALAAAAMGALVAGAFLFLRSSRVRLVAIAGAGTIALGLVIVVVIGMLKPASVPDTVELRGRWWRAAVKVAYAAPLLGKGPDAFSIEHSRFRTAEDVAATQATVETDPHSVPLALLAGAGLVGLLGFTVAIAWLLMIGYRSAFQRPLAAGFFGGTAAYVGQALVSIDTIALRSTFWSIAGGLAAVAFPEVVAKRKSKGGKAKLAPKTALPLRLAGVPLLAIGVLLAAGASIRLVSADAHFQDATSAIDGDSFEETRSQFESAVGKRSEGVYRASLGSFLGRIAVQLAEQGATEESRALHNDSRQAFAFTSDIPDVRSTTTFARTMRAWAATDPQAVGDALDLYERALALDPFNYLLYEEAAAAAEELGEPDRAAEFAQQAAALREQAGL